MSVGNLKSLLELVKEKHKVKHFLSENSFCKELKFVQCVCLVLEKTYCFFKEEKEIQH